MSSTPYQTSSARTAVVLSGSGCSATASFGVGVMQGLHDNAAHHHGTPFNPTIFSGSGFGGFNATIMAAELHRGVAGALNYLRDAWLDGICSTDSRPNGVFRLRGNPLPLFEPKAWMGGPAPAVNFVKDMAFLAEDLTRRIQANFSSSDHDNLLVKILKIPAMTPLFDMSPLQAQLAKQVDLNKLAHSTAELLVVASDWARGAPHLFTRHEINHDIGLRVLQASAAFTLAFPFVEIYGRPFAGAPGTMATPLQPVIDNYAAGEEPLTIHVVFLDRPMADIPYDKPDNALGGLGRWFTQNEAVNIHAQAEYGHPPSTTLKAHGVAHQAEPVTHPPEIHYYRPRKPIVNWFEFANFDRKTTEDFMAKGADVARHHDCATEGCIVNSRKAQAA